MYKWAIHQFAGISCSSIDIDTLMIFISISTCLSHCFRASKIARNLESHFYLIWQQLKRPLVRAIKMCLRSVSACALKPRPIALQTVFQTRSISYGWVHSPPHYHHDVPDVVWLLNWANSPVINGRVRERDDAYIRVWLAVSATLI